MARSLHLPVDFGHVLMFRRAVGYPDDGVLDSADPPAPPPTFVASSAHFDADYPLRPRAGAPWPPGNRGGASSGEESNSRMLHAEQHYDFHRQPRVGEVLTAEIRDGATWTKEGRQGTMQFAEILTEFRDEAGEPVVTSRAVRVTLPPQGQS
ncbi:hypothetical protein GCM10010472_01990 [Pseudonocardia halophobica]|uniref:FAS1-like dehydratase domain-containing protein n=1 Tax=Pseudonocardia halophobica TaxID=29401 RepID=A0A9W6L3R4_9PSEU|nr:MaoC family dehydratase N-terminal domain-containing protein [Pseudonocardia halophobica]GLL10539.1 hypothetical protein GCM10017577_16790 [Pseudonocardia halophobica]